MVTAPDQEHLAHKNDHACAQAFWNTNNQQLKPHGQELLFYELWEFMKRGSFSEYSTGFTEYCTAPVVIP